MVDRFRNDHQFRRNIVVIGAITIAALVLALILLANFAGSNSESYNYGYNIGRSGGAIALVRSGSDPQTACHNAISMQLQFDRRKIDMKDTISGCVQGVRDGYGP